MKDIQKAVELILEIAADDSHGYDQADRNGPDYDCSSLVSTVLHEAGFNINPHSWTGNMYAQLKADGFVSCKAQWKAGDIHLTPGKHVAMSVSETEIAHASLNEKGKIIGGVPGDQTGKEICVRSYYEKPWTYHLRFPQSEEGSASVSDIAKEVIQGKWGNGVARKKALEATGWNYSEVQSVVNAMLAVTNNDDLLAVAREVIRGKWGNGAERRKALEACGYNYSAVQAVVIRLMKGVK